MQCRRRGCGEKSSILETVDLARFNMYFETVDWATSKPSLSRRESAARPKADFPCTYGARDLGVLDQSRAGRLDCESSSATRRKTYPVPANDCLRTHDRRGVADIGATPIQPGTTPDYRRKAATFSEPFGAECSADGEGRGFRL